MIESLSIAVHAFVSRVSMSYIYIYIYMEIVSLFVVFDRQMSYQAAAVYVTRFFGE